MRDDELSRASLDLLMQANAMSPYKAEVCAILYQALVSALAVHFPGEVRTFIADIPAVVPHHVEQALAGVTKQ